MTPRKIASEALLVMIGVFVGHLLIMSMHKNYGAYFWVGLLGIATGFALSWSIRNIK